MIEWSIPMDQTIVIFIILFVITWKIWNLTNASEMIDKKENENNTMGKIRIETLPIPNREI